MHTDNLVKTFIQKHPKCIVHSGGPYVRTQDIDICVLQGSSELPDLYGDIKEALPRLSYRGVLLIKDIQKNNVPDSRLVQLLLYLETTNPSLTVEVINTYPSGVIAIRRSTVPLTLFPTAEAMKTISDIRVDHNIGWGIFKIHEWMHVPWIADMLMTKAVKDPVDLVYTLADAPSNDDNESLRISLRSVHKNFENIRNVWVVTDNPPTWLNNAQVIREKDTFTNCKDANIINKVLAACKHPDVTDRFIFMSDDQAVNTKIPANRVSPVFNIKGLQYYINSDGHNRWTTRMENTLKTVSRLGGDCRVNWDSHVPQPIDKDRFIDVMNRLPYTTLPGLCINTAYFGAIYEPPLIPQDDVKQTFEECIPGPIQLIKPYIGYNDKGYNSGLREVLMDTFNDPCIYEK